MGISSMRILIVGNDPRDIGGVVNYTRPLAAEFVKLGHEVFYLFSGAWNRRYNWLFRQYISVKRSELPFALAEIVNSTNLPFNFGDPLVDISNPQLERIITKYIMVIKPHVAHIHSRLGIPTSIMELLHHEGIPIVNTVHVYGYLCQRRVMIDWQGNLCVGPTDMRKCAMCTGIRHLRKARLAARFWVTKRSMRRLFPAIYDALRSVVSHFRMIEHRFHRRKESDLHEHHMSSVLIDGLAAGLRSRLEYNIHCLNEYSKMNICVSNDVRQVLMRYGVEQKRLTVQHIGSSIADKQIYRRKGAGPLRIVLANIGGMSYYKGTHVLIDALQHLRNNNYELRIHGWGTSDYVDALKQRADPRFVRFMGPYGPDDIPDILADVDVVVLTSICSDTAPQTIFEAFSQYAPIIAPKIGGFTDYVRHRRTGLLYEPGSAHDLSRTIDYVLNNHKVLHFFRKNIPKLRTISEDAKQLIGLYESVCHCPGRVGLQKPHATSL